METVVSGLTTAFTSAVTSVEGAIGSIVPIAIPLVGIGLAIRLGIKYFKSVANK